MLNDQMTVWVGTDIRIAHRDGEYFSTHPALNDATISRCRLEGMRVVLVAREDTQSSNLVHPLTAMDDIFLIREGSGNPLVRLRRVLGQVWRVPVQRDDVVVCRIPEVIGTTLWSRGGRARCVTIANMVAEGRAAASFLGRDVGRLAECFEIVPRFVARHSSGTIYVTRSLLQRRYPPGNRLTLSMSNVQLPDGWLVDRPREFSDGQLHRLVAVGNLDSDTKGIDLAITALATAVESVPHISLTIIGEGSTRTELAAQANAAGVADRVRFAGFVGDKDSLRQLLDESDLLVMPSRSEGLPRVAVEGQARGLPCVASDAGGLPEVVPADGLHSAGDVDQLARLIVQAHRDGAFASHLATEGHALALDIVRSAAPENFTGLLAAAKLQSTLGAAG